MQALELRCRPRRRGLNSLTEAQDVPPNFHCSHALVSLPIKLIFCPPGRGLLWHTQACVLVRVRETPTLERQQQTKKNRAKPSYRRYIVRCTELCSLCFCHLLVLRSSTVRFLALPRKPSAQDPTTTMPLSALPGGGSGLSSIFRIFLHCLRNLSSMVALEQRLCSSSAVGGGDLDRSLRLGERTGACAATGTGGGAGATWTCTSPVAREACLFAATAASPAPSPPAAPAPLPPAAGLPCGRAPERPEASSIRPSAVSRPHKQWLLHACSWQFTVRSTPFS